MKIEEFTKISVEKIEEEILNVETNILTLEKTKNKTDDMILFLQVFGKEEKKLNLKLAFLISLREFVENYPQD
jgi:hypothetical protein